MKITKRIVDAATPASDGRQLLLWDSEVKGFALRVTPAGAKSYIVNYRIGGRERRYTIGKHGAPWTCEEARAKAVAVLRDVANGIDPLDVKAAEKTAPTVADVASRFLEEHADAKRKTTTAKEYRRLLEKEVLPILGKRKVADIKRPEIAKLHHDLRDKPYIANRVLAILSKLFNLAEVWGYRPDGSNPCRHVERFGEEKRERFLSADELSRLGDALAEFTGSPYIPAAIKLLVFTGARLNEVLTLQWVWIDFDRCEARLPDSKTGAKTVHLPPPAMAILADLPQVEGNPHVIVGERPGAHLVNLEKPWRQIRERAGLAEVRLHDLRHAFASVAASAGMGLPIIGKMLGHTQAQTTQRYAHLASDPVKAAAATVAGKIADAMTSNRPESAPGNVVPLPGAGRRKG